MVTFRKLMPSLKMRATAWARKKRLWTVERLEALFFDICAAAQPDLFIEAEAKDASSSRRARSRLPEATIVAFEANPYTYRRFSRNKDNAPLDVRYLNMALSDVDGPVTFNVRVLDGKPCGDGRSSLLLRQNSGAGNLQVTVDACRLDRYFSADAFGSAALWVDVEGANRQVLMGASGILHKVAAIFIEVEEKPFWQDQWLATDVLAYLAGFGLCEVARDRQERHQYNCLLVRRDLLETDRIQALLDNHRRGGKHRFGRRAA